MNVLGTQTSSSFYGPTSRIKRPPHALGLGARVKRVDLDSSWEGTSLWPSVNKPPSCSILGDQEPTVKPFYFDRGPDDLGSRTLRQLFCQLLQLEIQGHVRMRPCNSWQVVIQEHTPP